MADTNSVQYAKIANAATSYSPNAANESRGKIQVEFFEHTCESESIADTISLCQLPANARVLGIKWASADLSAGSATLAIGDADDADRFVAALDVSSAIAYDDLVLRSPDAVPTTVGFGYEYSATTVLTATVAVAALNTGILAGCVIYVAA